MNDDSFRKKEPALPTHCTGVGPVSTTIHLQNMGENEDQEITTQAVLVAFTWDDDDPTTPTGYWYSGEDLAAALVWVPASAVTK